MTFGNGTRRGCSIEFHRAACRVPTLVDVERKDRTGGAGAVVYPTGTRRFGRPAANAGSAAPITQRTSLPTTCRVGALVRATASCALAVARGH
jgi:hypothetical protein